MSADNDAADLARAARGGICARCSNARLVRSSTGSVFLLCKHPQLPKYPRQPVLECHGFEPDRFESDGFESDPFERDGFE